jgi:hypothetical protein
LVEELH